ncbi:hypothetical protein [Candidatus Clostridium stratigraminis]|uniref:Uncharacterized protein n=1 Tax=Candidatus Clostridium stratigraminis TaxID=3381661 RepID=A0ABW8T7L8_9CLOT
MKKAFIKVNKALARNKEFNINLEGFKKELEQIAEETIISIDVCSRYTREALRDIRTI